jgi:hypothetical protein
MFGLIMTLLILFTPAPAGVNTTQHYDWWDEFFKTELLLGLGIPLASAITWLARDYISKDQEVGRAKFKNEIITSLQSTLTAAAQERDTVLSLKLTPMQNSIDRLGADYYSNLTVHQRIEESIDELFKSFNDLNLRLTVMESTLSATMSKINSELSTLLTAYIGESVKVRLFMDDDDKSKPK